MIRAEAVTHHAGDAPELLMDEGITAIFDGIPEKDRNPGVHIMTGPIFFEDAKAGDVIEVRYLQMIPRLKYGSNLAANWGYLYKEFGETKRVTVYQLDGNSQQASALFAYDVKEKYLTPGRITHAKDCCREPALKGIRVPVRPHLGTAGVAPDEKGSVSTIPPGLHGGNIDNWRIGAGATMYYPVMVDGALFSIGDPHISQRRRRTERHRHRSFVERPVPDFRAQGFPLCLAIARNTDRMDRPWLRRGPEYGHAQGVVGDALSARRKERSPKTMIFDKHSSLTDPTQRSA
jgi:hypothetical protein